jgi:hypothetical protein
VHGWPSDTDGEIPSPTLVAAWLVLDDLPTERVPFWAAHWLAAGYGNDEVTELAGLRGDDRYEIPDLLMAALVECGVAAIDLDRSARSLRRAAATTAFSALAELCMEGRAGERWVVSTVVETVEPDFYTSITDLPLGRLVDLDSEWNADGGTEEQLSAEVRRACRDRLRAALLSSRSRHP